MKFNILFCLSFLFAFSSSAQLPDSCKLRIGTNFAGIFDWSTEIPFVDLMHMSREWGTKSIGDPTDPYDSGFADELSYRADGYPTHLPQSIGTSQYDQSIFTIWAITSGWPVGEYTVLYEGDGDLRLWGRVENVQMTGPGRYTFDMNDPFDGTVVIFIDRSEVNDPIRNIRLLMPGTEQTYQEDPFYDLWEEKADVFDIVRFMDWGATNNWGEEEGMLSDSNGVDWSERSIENHYTWATNKGVPYEFMIDYMNLHEKDGWICIPHSANEDYIRSMARFFRDNLDADRHLYVEYSNEIWNWIFDQARWTSLYGCDQRGEIWPEGTVRYIQRVMDIWTEEFDGELDRITRVVGVQAGWQDVVERVVRNVDINSFDVISPTYYFGLSEDGDEVLDNLGATATAADVVREVRKHMPEAFEFIQDVNDFGVEINKPLAFYEGGQHITPHPFGVEPTYTQALLDVQRDTAMYNMYNEWFNRIRTLQSGNDPLVLMNFSFVTGRSAQFGSWGVLETMDQDTSLIPAPKYKAVIENMNWNCKTSTSSKSIDENSILLMPNPTDEKFRIIGLDETVQVKIYHSNGALMGVKTIDPNDGFYVDGFPNGLYLIIVHDLNGNMLFKKQLIKN